MTAQATKRPTRARSQHNGPVAGMQAGARMTCAVHLIDRITGLAHVIGGVPLIAFTKDPVTVSAELLSRRDPARFATRIERLGAEGRT